MAMTRDAVRFWVAAVAAAGAWAVATSLLISVDGLGFETGAERLRVWLLALWTSGVMAICFGAAGLLGYGAPLGFREVAEAGSLTEAMAARRQAARQSHPFHRNFAWWLIVTGALLIGTYFLAWGITNA
jgi:hypothetical protein